MRHSFLLRLCCLLLALSATLSSWAVPAARNLYTHTQKDGTQLTLMLVGDEHMHYYVNVADGSAMRRQPDGDFIPVTEAELAEQAQYATARATTINQQRMARLSRFKQSQMRMQNGPRKVGAVGAMTGSKKGLVILVNFADKGFTAGVSAGGNYEGTAAIFDDMFNKEGYNENGHIGSVHDYFLDQSYGVFNLSFDVVGPVTVSQNMAYYGAPQDKDNDSYPASMVIEACQLADAEGVNFADYDWDDDGEVDQVFVVYAGHGQNFSGSDENTIWPHEWSLYAAKSHGDGTGPQKLDGVWVNTYAVASELYGSSSTNLNGIGTAVHEFSHCLGYPDSYDTDYSGGIGMAHYDVMCSGNYNGTRGAVPVGYTAYERWCAGWLTPTELTTPISVTDMPTLNDEGVAYIIRNSDNADEFLLLENRQSKRWFSYYGANAAGHGLFVMHVDYDAWTWQMNKPNDDPERQRMAWIPADGTYGTYDSSKKNWTVSNAEHRGDFFPGTSNVTTLNATSHQTVGGKWFFSGSGSYAIPHTLTDIVENTTTGTIAFDFDGGSRDDDGTRYTITLDACGGSVSETAWTQTVYRQSWTLPAPTTTVEGWYGAGWVLAPISNDTPLDDVDLIDYYEPYEPESNVTLYAVYINEDYICNSYPGEEGGDITITPISGIPAGYYNNTIVGKNDRTLELALKTIVNPHTVIGYNSLWQAFETTDVVPTALLKDPAKADQVYDMYADNNAFAKYYSDGDHSQTGGFNREHCVPNSWWGGKTGNAVAYSDLHHLVPSDGAANSAKSNHPLGEYKAGMTLSWPTETKTNTDGYTYVVADNTADHSGSWSHVWNTTSSTKVFEPADEFKGDFARMYLYVVCTYEGDLTWQTADNTMFSNGANNYTVIANDAKALLLKWHRQDPVSDKERLRNNSVQSIQGNRNPFIDYPILVEYVWGDSIAKTSFSLERMPSAYQFGVTYCVGKNVTCSEQVRLCDRGSAVTLPAATTSVDGWTFCGWATEPIENTTTAPSLLTGSYTPTADVKLYAVFQADGTYSITPEEPGVPGGEDGAAALYFPHIAKLGQPFTEPAFTTNSDGAQTWTSSNTDVATVDSKGKVTIWAVGTTIITVMQAESRNYKAGSASYMIRVVE